MTTPGQTTAISAAPPPPLRAAPRGWRGGRSPASASARCSSRAGAPTGTRRSRCCGRRSTPASTTSTPPSSTATATRSSGPRWRPTRTTWCWSARSGRSGTPAAASSRPSGRSSCAPRSRPTWPRSGSTRSAWSTCAASTPPPGIVAEGEQLVDIDDQLAELAALRDAGKIGGIGLSSVSAEQLDRALPAGIACVQNLYSVIDRTARARPRPVPRARRRLGAVLPARLGVRRAGPG